MPSQFLQVLNILKWAERQVRQVDLPLDFLLCLIRHCHLLFLMDSVLALFSWDAPQRDATFEREWKRILNKFYYSCYPSLQCIK
jgi:hypothetical protein